MTYKTLYVIISLMANLKGKKKQKEEKLFLFFKKGKKIIKKYQECGVF